MSSMAKSTTEAVAKPVWITADIIAKAHAEVERLQKQGQAKATIRRVVEHWMRIGADKQPQIKGILT